MADRGKQMCKACWTMSRDRGRKVEEIDVGAFDGR